jgi:ABC-type amino acid transport substrate-binding protein
MLENNRAEVYIETLVDVWEPAKRNGIDMNNYQMETLWTENYYIAFSKSDKSKKLIEIYDKRIPELLQSGELKQLFEKWKYEFLPDIWKPKRDS